MNFRTFSNFIGGDAAEGILLYQPPMSGEIRNEHIRAVNEATKGWSVLCDLTRTEVSAKVSAFQGDSTVVDAVPGIFHTIARRISEIAEIGAEHVFFQYIVVGSGGEVKRHYDAAAPGYVTYKCNICIDGPDDDAIYVDKQRFPVARGDLYCFEASLYGHRMEKHDRPRVHLSYGFMLPYARFGLDETSPRVRLSRKIWRHFVGE